MAPDPGNDVAAQQAMARGMVMFIVSLSCLNEEEFRVGRAGHGLHAGRVRGFPVRAGGGRRPGRAGGVVESRRRVPRCAVRGGALNCGLQMGGGPPPG